MFPIRYLVVGSRATLIEQGDYNTIYTIYTSLRRLFVRGRIFLHEELQKLSFRLRVSRRSSERFEILRFVALRLLAPSIAMVGVTVKEEREVLGEPERKLFDPLPIAVMDHDSTDESDSDVDDGKENGAASGKKSRGSDREGSNKKQTLEDAAVVLPLGFVPRFLAPSIAMVKEEREVLGESERKLFDPLPIAVIDHDSTDESDSDVEDGMENGAASGKRSRGSDRERSNKRQRLEDAAVVLPLGFLDPLPPEERLPWPGPEPIVEAPLLQVCVPAPVTACKQFWKAGDYEGDTVGNSGSAGIDHVRVHPKFLHSNATSHKWALGAFAELLDNSLDEICNGASFVNIDMLQNKKDKSIMLFVQDNGGGMDPDIMRQCMSLGYSAKSKSANTIGKYGNGFKTSTMRLGADVIVFSRCRGKDGKSPTQSIGLLSYTFLRNTGKEDIVVPTLDYEKEGEAWKGMVRSSQANWNTNLETIVEWSPFYSEDDLLQQFNSIEDQGTRIIIYNLWEDDQGELELDFSADPHDIQIRGVNRDEKKIQMAKEFPNSRHFLTYRHSLRSYASILYLRLPLGFRIILRGKDVDHHNIANDMIHIQEITYRPQSGVDGPSKDSNMVAVVTIGFVKDAREHIDVQGFNVYHKNRLIKPFWRVWNAAGSSGRGVLGVLEANFVEPAHDKQGFERTTVLQRLEMRLIQMQKTYWGKNCEKVGYAPRQQKKQGNDHQVECAVIYSKHEAAEILQLHLILF
ncbi:protein MICRORCHIDIA 7-like [Aristolochia californica]|uniref:protein MICRORCHIDIA 7-like n=1 Tax=Aristolochia californica TaxID=171875 RepID=UPI0035E0EF65